MGFGLFIAGLFVQGASQIAAGYQQKQLLERQADQAEAMAEYNAEVAERNARREQEQRQQQESAERREARRRRARIEAAFAKNGVMMQGSPTLLLTEQAAIDEYNIQSATEASDLRVSQIRQEGMLLRTEGENAAAGYRASADSALLGAVTKTIGTTMTATAYGYEAGFFGD